MTDGLKILYKIAAEALVLFLALYIFLFPISINGGSMQTTLYDGDRVIASRFMGRLGLYGIGDIVIFHENSHNEGRNIVKRIIAMENDKVEIRGGRVFVNGVPVPEEYISGYTRGDVDLTVPENCLYVMGDNREVSYDSRSLGSINKSDVKAKVIAKVFPLSEFKLC